MIGENSRRRVKVEEKSRRNSREQQRERDNRDETVGDTEGELQMGERGREAAGDIQRDKYRIGKRH